METEALGLAKIVSFSFIVSFTFLWRQYTETQIIAMLKERNLFLFLTKYIYILTKLQPTTCGTCNSCGYLIE